MSESKVFSALEQHNEVVEQALAFNSERIEQYAKTLAEAFVGGNRLVVVGSGPLAGIASVMVNNFVYRLGAERPSLPAVAVNLDCGLATTLCVAQQFDDYYSCLVQAQAKAGDCVCFLDCFAAPAMLAALGAARETGCHTGVFSGGTEEAWQSAQPDLLVAFAAPTPARGIEAMLFVGHILCELVENELFGI